MENFLDRAWEYIAAVFIGLGNMLFDLIAPLHFLGPVVIITLLALSTVALTKILKPYIMTRRYRELEDQFQYWYHLRAEAMKIEDETVGKRMARNIDQAELNRAYYDYFFEGFMLGLAGKVIPIFFVFGFVNEFYKPEQMRAHFGREYVLAIPTTGSEPLLAGPVFWYVLSVLGSYILWFAVSRIVKSIRLKEAWLDQVCQPQRNMKALISTSLVFKLSGDFHIKN